MTTTATSYTFRALTAEGAVILQSRGRAGALRKVLEALQGHRDAVAAGSGYLYGNPQALGDYSVDGVARPFGPAAYIFGAESEEVARLDRLGLTRVAEISREVDVELAA